MVWRRRVLSPPAPRPASSARAGVQFLSAGRRLHCCPAGVGAALFLLRRPRSLWPRPPWVFLLKVTTSLFKNSAEKEKTLYPTLWAVISREYPHPRGAGGRAGGRAGPGPGRGAGLGGRPSASRLGPAAGRRPRRLAASNMADGGVCGGGGGRCRGGGRASGPRPGARWESERLGRRGRVRVGGALGSRGRGGAGGSALPPAAWSPHPSPVVLCCFRGGGRAVAPRGLGPAAPTRRSAAPSPPSFGRPAGGATGAVAGAVGYEWSGAGPRRPPVTAAGGGRALGGRPPSGGGKLTPRGARRRGTPVSGSEGERGLWPLLEASGPPLRPPRRPGLGPVAFTHPPSHLPEPED